MDPIVAALPEPLPPFFSKAVLLHLLSVALLIAINAFFVTAEFATISVRRSRISQLVEAGDVQARAVQSLQRSIDRLLSTTQLGITLSSLALGWIGEKTLAVAIAAALAGQELVAHAIAVPLAFVLLVYLQIVLGELVPKSLALMYAEQVARVLGPPSVAIAQLFGPFIWVLNQSTRWLLRLLGARGDGQGWYTRVTSEELQLIINTERESTGLEIEERELLNNIFEFGEVLVEAVMVPRTQIVSLPSTTSFGTLLETVVASGHSRFPISGESLDDIRGAIDFKELAEPLARGQLSPEDSVQPWVRPVRFVPEFTPLSELLPLMQRSRLELVMVVDEFGGTAGLVTLQDLIDEIIGDESEPEIADETSVQMLDEQTFLVQAHANIEELNELLDLELPLTDEYQTLGGFLQYQFQKIPVQGETLTYNALDFTLDFTVVAADGPRLQQVRIYRHEVFLDRDRASDAAAGEAETGNGDLSGGDRASTPNAERDTDSESDSESGKPLS